MVDEFVLSLAQIACTKSLPHFRSTGVATGKSEHRIANYFDPLTQADMDVELALRSAIKSRYPEHGIIGEEFPAHQPDADTLWVLDPIDGTRSFVAGVPLWMSLIGQMKLGKAIAGLMVQPFTGEVFYSVDESGSYMLRLERDAPYAPIGTPLRLKTSGCEQLDQACLFATAPELFSSSRYSSFLQVRERCKFNRFGADAYAFAMLAMGFVDLVVETGLKPHDIMASIAIIERAGGCVTRWDGGAAEKGGDIIAAASPALHKQALDILQQNVT